ncbi:hypothetical protein [Ruminococcus sp.]|jgi:cytochrome bd-type quinol oxidase subunit 2|uniref:hypothetical protein n=1 Tax=Ruminococcus sp. TaxID=41978 RepID=UPI002627A94B|nr:hypothetical protein [Ruminococcus sp.]MCI2113150.1 hypothetical protein [Ruminococcus sp.]MDD6987938.1 hypothetical protein [Ruminococcus sp.]MDY6201499.1 hypothetical protein [Ruminococcus sp.]
MSDYTIGFLIGFCVVITIFLIIAIVLRCKNNHVTEYDERQLIARNTAYKYSFFTLVFYCILCGMLDIAEIKWAETVIQMFLGMFLSVAVFVVICIFKDAYFGIEKGKNNIRTFLLLSVIITVIQLFNFIYTVFIEKEPIITDGMLNSDVTPLLCAVAFLIMIIATVIKIVISKKEREEE